jgi:CRP-like cAMP-binding protein
MYLKQKDIFGSLGKDFVKEIMDTAETASHNSGELLFKEGDRADWFFILLKGSIKLSLGQTGQTIYLVSHAGEAFGWSSLVGRNNYSATAECLSATKLLRFDKHKLEKIAEKDTLNGMALFKSLAAILGNRLLQSYASSFSTTRADEFSSYGTGQVMDVVEKELEK